MRRSPWIDPLLQVKGLPPSFSISRSAVIPCVAAVAVRKPMYLRQAVMQPHRYFVGMEGLVLDPEARVIEHDWHFRRDQMRSDADV